MTSQLSGGNRKKLSLACAFIGKPNLVILDEPSHGIDIKFKANFWNILKNKQLAGTSIIIGTSDINEVQILCDKILLIKNS